MGYNAESQNRPYVVSKAPISSLVGRSTWEPPEVPEHVWLHASVT